MLNDSQTYERMKGWMDMSKHKLFTPLKIGTMEMKNRIAMAPMTLGLESEDGTIGEKLTRFWEDRAAGGVGLIIVDVVTVDGAVPYLGHTISLHDDAMVPSFKPFIERMHAHGAKVIPQISHPGPESISWTYGVQPVGPSAYPNQFGKVVKELGIQEIERIIGLYGDAARRAKEAGFDGVELHCAHAYMLAGSFLSPLRNKRIDQYGGGLDGRARFTLEIIRDMKEKAGEDFPIIMRISGDEKVPGGNTLSDMLYLIPKFIEAGIDGFEVSGGTQYETNWKLIPGHSEEVGLNADAAAAIKNISSVPVIVVGKMNDPQYADHTLTTKNLDGIVMGRALLADADLPNKALAGRYEDIAPCTGCGIGCTTREPGRDTATCVINPMVGKEKEMKITSAESSKQVLIVGGGVAGLETARVAAIRGHNVKVFEKSNKLGGQINIAAVPPHKQDLVKWIIYLKTQVEKLGVQIELGKEGTLENIQAENPDVIIVATGAEPVIPHINGIDDERVVTAFDYLEGKTEITKGNVMVVGGGMVGAEVAETLIANGRGNISVNIVEMSDTIAAGLAPINRIPLIQRLEAANVTFSTEMKMNEITEHGVLASHLDGTGEMLFAADKIILACGAQPVDGLYTELLELGKEIHIIGDSKSPRKALEAIAEGAVVGRAI